jgi:RNA exonuclease NGL2
MKAPALSQADVDAKRAARAAKKLAAAALLSVQGPKPLDITSQPFLLRSWHRFAEPNPRFVTVMTWNILAQTLIRRDLFPGATSLRWSERSKMLHQLLHYSPTLACLQEVDRFEDHAKVLRPAYNLLYEKGYESKKHGLCLCWKRDAFELLRSQHARLDDLEVEPGRTGLSRRTRNIGLVAALRRVGSDSGVILATLRRFLR